MKKIFILPLAAAAVAFAGCSNDNEGTQPDNSGNAITFRSVIQKTRATETDLSNIRDFKVFGLWNGNFELMYGVNVVRDNATGTWEYAPKLYWPSGGSNPDDNIVDFFAFSPAGSRNVSNVFTATANTPTFTYAVPIGGGLQEDFLVAATPNQTEANTPVLINFKHALSQAVFAARSTLEDITYNVSAIELTNLKSTADLDLSAATPAWSNVAAVTEDYPAALETIPVTYRPPLSDDFTRLSGPNDGLMLLPQTLVGTGDDANDDGIPDDEATGNYLVVTYGVTLASKPNVEIVPAGTKVYLPIAAALTSGFEMGKKYIFQLELGTAGGSTLLKPIIFDVKDVEDWEPDLDGDGNDDTVPVPQP